MGANDKGWATRHNPTGALPDRLRAAAPYLGVVDALLMEEAATALEETEIVVRSEPRVIATPAHVHDCRDGLPGGDRSTDTGYPAGTLVVCQACDRAWFVASNYNSTAPTAWRPVRWWHLGLRGRVAAWRDGRCGCGRCRS